MISLKGDSDLQKRAVFLGLFVAFLIYVLCSFVALQKPFNLDEADFASLAHYIKICGKPILYVAEDFIQDLCGLKLYSPEKHLGYGLWHTPLYANLLGAWFKIFGETTVTGRLFGFSCALLSLLLLFKIIKEICIHESIDRGGRFFISSLAAILYFINPLILQFSLLLDIDNSLLTLLVLLFFYVFIKNHTRRSVKTGIFLGVIFGISLLAKLPTPPFALASIFIFYALRGEIKKAFLETFLIGSTGVIFFITAWLTYALSLNLPLDFFLVYNYGTKVLPAAHNGIFFAWPLMARTAIFSIFWVSPAFVALSLMAVLNETLAFLKTKKVSPLFLLVIFSLLLFFVYTVIYPRVGMMKYQFMNAPILILVISFFIFRVLEKIAPKELFISFFAGVVLFLFDYLCMPDSVFFALYFPAAAGSVPAVMFYLLPLLILPLGLSLYFSGGIKAKYLVLGSLVALFAYNISLDFKQMAPYTTTYDWNYYGEIGLQDTINYLDENLSDDGVLICRKDVGYYLKEMKNHPNRKWYSSDNCFNLPPQDKDAFFLKVMAKDDVEFIELDGQAVRDPNLPQSLPNYFYPDKQFGNFLILKRKR